MPVVILQTSTLRPRRRREMPRAGWPRSGRVVRAAKKETVIRSFKVDYDAQQASDLRHIFEGSGVWLRRERNADVVPEQLGVHTCTPPPFSQPAFREALKSRCCPPTRVPVSARPALGTRVVVACFNDLSSVKSGPLRLESPPSSPCTRQSPRCAWERVEQSRLRASLPAIAMLAIATNRFQASSGCREPSALRSNSLASRRPIHAALGRSERNG